MEYLYLSKLPSSFKLDRLIVYVESEYEEEFNTAVLRSYSRICDFCSLRSFRFVYVPLAGTLQAGYKRKLIARNYPMLGDEERRKLLVSWAQDGTAILTRKLLSRQAGCTEPVTRVSGFLCRTGVAMPDGSYPVERFSYRELVPGQDVWLEIRRFVEELEAEERREEETRRRADEIRRSEEGTRRREAEVRRSEEEIRRRADEVRRSEEETRRSGEETRRNEEEVRRSEDEIRRSEDEARKREEEDIRCRKMREEAHHAEARRYSLLPEERRHFGEDVPMEYKKKQACRKPSWFDKIFNKLSNEIFSDDMPRPEKPVDTGGSGTSLPLDIVAETVKEGSELLVRNGYYDLLIDALGYDVIEEIAERIKQVELQSMAITDDFRILLGRERVEVKLSPLAKAFYFLYLRHPEGIAFKCLVDYRHELLEIYKLLTAKENFARIEESIAMLTDATNNSANEKCSRIRAAFLAALGKERVASFYYISGSKGEKKKIALERSLVSGLEVLGLGIQ